MDDCPTTSRSRTLSHWTATCTVHVVLTPTTSKKQHMSQMHVTIWLKFLKSKLPKLDVVEFFSSEISTPAVPVDSSEVAYRSRVIAVGFLSRARWGPQSPTTPEPRPSGGASKRHANHRPPPRTLLPASTSPCPHRGRMSWKPLVSSAAMQVVSQTSVGALLRL